MDKDAVFAGIVFVGLIVVFIGIVVGGTAVPQDTPVNCEESCAPHVAIRLSGECYCQVEGGYLAVELFLDNKRICRTLP